MKIELKTLSFTCLAMLAFAANSIIARQALLASEIGPISFTVIRLFAGAIVLALLVGLRKSWHSGSWIGAIYLLIYAGFFSLAYVSLPAGIGALILFTAVQITMIGSGLIHGERLTFIQGLGALLAFAGLVFLLNPGTDAPHLFGSLLMVCSGIGWGLYSLKGRGSQNPTAETSGNFIRASVLAFCVLGAILLVRPESPPQTTGILLAILSGAITSGMGYAIWYTVLPSLSAVRAGLAQLSVPAIAALGGIILLAEAASPRLIISSLVILVGVAIATLSKSRKIN
ncbi:MAG: DMT family transporter [Acidimicrobiales bacterium]|nr:DMT family transporter [Hyphomonadaceae bacterium]RZV43441.1 MAG: DMT family transporter [Acidimicrobiales bacterium]